MRWLCFAILFVVFSPLFLAMNILLFWLDTRPTEPGENDGWGFNDEDETT